MNLAYIQIPPQSVYVNESDHLDFLDNVYTNLCSGNVDLAMTQLGQHLYELYVSTSSHEWDVLVQKKLLTHPIKQFLFQDPHTARSFEKPRGYSGDAELLDMVYFPENVDLSNISEIGKNIFKFNTKSNIARSLRKRLEYISNCIDVVCNQNRRARILSVGSGHCREAEYSQAVKLGAFESFVCLDQDMESLKEARNCYGSLGLSIQHTSIIDLLRGKSDIGQYDLIYSSGLYDYLGTRSARKLTSRLFESLAPNGKLIICNISHEFPEIGYFESYMKWSMFGRNEIDMLDLVSDIRSEEKASLNANSETKISSHYVTLEIDNI